MTTPLVPRLQRVVEVLWREVAKFGAVGLVAFVVDVGISNALWGTQASPGPMHDSATKAKCIAVAVATVVAYLGNRFWTYRHRRRPAMAHEFAMFLFFNVVGMAIAAACLLVNDYVLGRTDALSRNIAGNGVGLVLGTLFRFWAYRTFVFRDERPGDPEPLAPEVAGTRAEEPSKPTTTVA
ncbi:GtrA family protein [Arsenicicoccus dermatophilus]|uniref:GtrA family protein n=1 Tax=Arsenicicoccus dermatophilus TaxID=1076331 RepID=UPI0038912C12